MSALGDLAPVPGVSEEPRYTAREFVLTYISWQSMRQRCSSAGARRDRAMYVDRGIRVCERWRNFEAFIHDVGPRPSLAHTLDRYPDKNGNYEPGNCRWATATEQAANTRRTVLLEHDGEILPIAEWARRTGIERATIQYRLTLGMSAAEALTTPVPVPPRSFSTGLKRGKKLAADQIPDIVARARAGDTARSIAARYGVTPTTISHVVRQYGVRFKMGKPKRSPTPSDGAQPESFAKLTAADVETIRARLRAGDTTVTIARELGVSPSTVRSVKTGQNWGWLQSGSYQ